MNATQLASFLPALFALVGGLVGFWRMAAHFTRVEEDLRSHSEYLRELREFQRKTEKRHAREDGREEERRDPTPVHGTPIAIEGTGIRGKMKVRRDDT